VSGTANPSCSRWRNKGSQSPKRRVPVAFARREELEVALRMTMASQKIWQYVPIEDLQLSMRVYSRLRKSGLISVGLILASTEDQILRSLQQPLGRAEEGVLLTMTISGKRVQAPDATASHKDWAKRSYEELRQRLDELGVVSKDADWDRARSVN
jgi:hypothetical protein